MTDQHTPGPWEVAHAGHGTSSRGSFILTEFYVRLPDADFALAADIVGADMKPNEANARLIAAAPELLEALIEVKQLLDMVLCVTGGLPEGANGPAAKALAAIRKATGVAQ